MFQLCKQSDCWTHLCKQAEAAHVNDSWRNADYGYEIIYPQGNGQSSVVSLQFWSRIVAAGVGASGSVAKTGWERLVKELEVLSKALNVALHG